MAELTTEREELIASDQTSGEPPRIDATTTLAYRQELEKAVDPREIKRILRMLIEETKLTPETLSVEITYRLPEPVLKGTIAGPGFEPGTFGL